MNLIRFKGVEHIATLVKVFPAQITSYPGGTSALQLHQRLPASASSRSHVAPFSQRTIQALAAWLRSGRPETSCIKLVAATELLIPQVKSRISRITFKACCIYYQAGCTGVVIASMLCSQGNNYFVALAVTLMIAVTQVDFLWVRVKNGDSCAGETKVSRDCMLRQKDRIPPACC